MHDNPIVRLQVDTFKNNKKLIILDLSATNLTYIHTDMFKENTKLKNINLSKTLLSSFEFIGNIHGAETLDLSEIHSIIDSFPNINDICCLKVVYVSKSKFCCLFNHINTECFIENQLFDVTIVNSCSNIITNSVIFGILVVYMMVIFFANALSLFMQLKDGLFSCNAYSILSINLNVVDELMAAYLFILLSMDLASRNDIVISTFLWRRSVLCKLAGTICTISVILSTFSNVYHCS